MERSGSRTKLISNRLRNVTAAAGLIGLSVAGGLAPSMAAAATSCAVPGKDGVATLTGVVNTYYPGTTSVPAGATSIQVGAPTGSATTITAGDLLLVVQVQDSATNSTNTDAYGDGVSGAPASGATDNRSTGLYEYVAASGPVSGGVVPVVGTGPGNGLNNAYDSAAKTATDGQRRFELVRVPQYSTATITSGLTAASWNGSTGGILAIDVAGSADLNGATVSLNGLGFRGGAGRQLNGDNTSSAGPTDYRFMAPVPPPDPQPGVHGSKGEGTAGTPRYVFTPATHVLDTGIDGYPNGSMGRGAPGNAGGGGTDSDVSDNEENSGGGGGGNGGAGGLGGFNWQSGNSEGGFGGAPAAPGPTRLTLGGAGGAGTKNNDDGNDLASSAAGGGSLVFFRAGGLLNSGTITANGLDAYNDTLNDGGGGGGAGGSLLLINNGGNLTGLTVNAKGGRGGDAWHIKGTGHQRD